MILAAAFTVQYALLILHIGAAATAFGTGFVHSILLRTARAGGQGARDAAEASLEITKRYTLPAMIVTVLLGIALVANSKDAYDFSQSWISSAFAVVIVLLLLSWFLTMPAQRALIQATADGGGAGKESKRVGMATGFLHLGFVILLVLMVWKPGA